jgi:uncharacterized repeat protein (TIGR01451 family)
MTLETRSRITRKIFVSFVVTLAGFATAAFAVLHRATTMPASPCTVTYSLTSSGGPVRDWTSTSTPWSPTPPAGQYPGANAGDCVSIGAGVQVQLQTATISLGDITIATSSSGPTTVFVGSGGSMTETAGTFNNSGNFEVDSNGVATFNTGSTQSVGGTVKINGGTLTINDTWGLFGQIDHAGGTLNGSGTLNVNSGVLLFDGSQGPMSVAMTNTINVGSSGFVNYNSSTNALSLSTPVDVKASSTFFVNAAVPLNGTSSITLETDTTGSFASGAMSRSTGASDITVNVPVNNNGTVAVTGTSGVGGIVLAGGGTHSGAFNSTSSKITFSGTHNFGTGSVVSAPAQITGASSIVNLTTTSGLTMGSGLTWDGGTINGPGKMNLLSASTFDTSSAPLQLNGEIQNQGALQVKEGNNFNMGSSSLLETSTTLGSLELLGDVNIPTTNGIVRVDSGAYLEPLDATGTNGATVGAFVDLAGGNINIGSTTPFHLAGGGNGTATSYIQVVGGRTVEFTGGTFTLNNPTPIGTAGFIHVNGGVVNFAGTSTGTSCSVTATTCITDGFSLISGQFYGPDITLNSGMTWQGGEIGGTSGSTVVHIPSGQFVNATTLTSQPKMHDATLDLNGTMNLNPLSQSPILEAASSLNISPLGILDLQNDGNVLSGVGGGTISNMNVLKKTGGSSGTRLDVVVNNSGGISSESASGGTVILNGGGTMTGGNLSTLSAANTIDVFGGVFSISNGTILGAGPTRTTGTGEIDITAATPITANAFSMVGGFLGGTGELDITKFVWSGGKMYGGGTTALVGNATLDGSSSSMILTNHTLVTGSGANVVYSPISNALDIQTGGVLNNAGGTITLQGSIGITSSTGGGSIINATGQTIDGNGTTQIDAAVTNNGTLKCSVNTSIIRLANSGTQTLAGTVDMSGGSSASLQLANGTYNDAGFTFIGPGSLVLNSGALNINNDKSVAHFGMSGGTTTVASPKTFTLGQFDFLGGTLTGAGTTNVNGAGMNVGSSAPTLVTGGHALALNATTSYNASSINFLTIGPSTSMTNFSTFNVNTAGKIGGSTGLIQNNGTFAIGAVIVQVDAAFNHSGTLTIPPGGTLNLAGGGSSTSTINNSGFLDFGGGTYTINPGTSTTIGGGVKVTAGTVNSSINLTLSNFGLLGGTFTGSGNLTFSNGVWSAGTLASTGAASATVSGGTFTIDGLLGAMTLDTRTLVNNSTINYPANTNALSLINGASINNASGATFDIKADQPISGGSITNAGTFQKSNGSGTSSLPPMSNSNTVILNSGTMSFPAYTQTAGTTTFLTGSIAVTPGTMQLNGGTLTGSGLVTGNVSNAGATIQPGNGLSTGLVQINGAYSQSAGNLNIRLGGTTPATQYDQLQVFGSSTLSGGNLNVSLINSFVPANGNTFDVFTFSSKSGDFANKFTPTFASGAGSFTATYFPTKLQLAAVITTVDDGVTQSAPSTVIHGQNATITLTVTNTGGSNSPSVTLTDSFSGAAFVSATPSQGTCSGTGPISCSLGTIASGGSATVALVLNANTIGTITSNATVGDASASDPNTANNNSSANITVLPASDLGVTVSDSPDPVIGGSNVTYTITTTNNGPDTSPGSTVNLTLNGGGTIVSTTGATCTSPTASTRQCTIGGLGNGGNNVITMVVTAPSSGPISVTATSVYGGDTFPANDTASQSTTVTGTPADMTVTKSGPASASSGGSVTYTLAVKNLGGTAASSVVVTDPTPSGLTLTGVTSAFCSSFPCNIGTVNGGQVITITASYNVNPNGPGAATNTATVSSASDANSTNNSSSVTTQIGCTTAVPQLSSPSANATNVPTAGVLSWSGNGSATYKVYLDIAGVGCVTANSIGTTSSTQLSYSGLQLNTDYEWRVEGITPNCSTTTSACGHFKTASSTPNCNTAPPSLITPANGSTVASPVHFSWSAVSGATQYDLFVALNGGVATNVATTSSTSADLDVDDGSATWFVIATVPANCGQLQSTTGNFNVCNAPVAPVVSVVADAASGQTYSVTWPAIAGVSKYELDEATNAAFTNATTQTVAQPPNPNGPFSVAFIKTALQSAQPFFYRVRAFSACNQAFGPYSIAVRIVILPLTKNTGNSNVNVPFGSNTKVVQQIFIPGQGGTFNFSATADQTWLTVTPSSGLLPADGITLQVTADPANLANGTFTGTIIVVLTPIGATGRAANEVTTVVNVPVSVSLVTPVTPTTNSALPAGALIIPSVGHLDGIDSHWQSDIRVTNAGNSRQSYSLTFTPDDPAKGTKTTQITIDAGGTTALDDIVRNWYGIGQLGESANGVLEIHPASSGTLHPAQATPNQSLVTVASSRTYNVTNNGTLGQYVPAIPFTNFIGKAAPNALAQVLSLQQVAQSAAFRTNFGLVEAAGKPASVVMSVFDTTGTKLKDIPIDIAAFQQIQLNQMLATNGITNLTDGRVEVKVANGDGKVTAYASVVDNGTNDPLLVSGYALGAALSNRFLLPGVAALNNGIANWRTDMRIFNPSAGAQNATLTFYPLGNPGAAIVKTASIASGQITVLDDVVQSLFGQSNAGGSVLVSTPQDSSLVVTGRTYDKTSKGTFGQFIPAVTPADALGLGGRPLQILQVEDSPRYRTNVGIAEVTGKPVTVEVSVVVPDSRVTPTLRLDLAANEYRQQAFIQEMGLGNVYNARISVKVVGGEGKITAYGSVIDTFTEDPTYVPAQ